ncbi:MAG: preQ(1) synthase [Desulfatibacillaceae bacterium]
MAENEKTRVGAGNPEPLDSVDPGTIEVIDYQYAGIRDIAITIEQPEFTSVCPMTGLPDFGTLVVEYTPDKRLVELKSLKYYYLQYRNVGVFYEHLVNRVLDDLVAALSPKSMEVRGVFTPRGGISTTARARYEW